MNILIDEKTIKENYVDPITAANMLHVSRSRINKLCQEGRFEGAIKTGWSWIIPRISVENFKPLRRGPKPNPQPDDKTVWNTALKNADNLKEGVSL